MGDQKQRCYAIDEFPTLDNDDARQQRFSEGWCFQFGEIQVRQHKVYKSPFETHEEATVFVFKRAEEGSEYHKTAVQYVVARRLLGTNGINPYKTKG